MSRRRRGPAAIPVRPPWGTIAYPEDLPVTARRPELLEAIAANQVVVVAGETGSGKSTQLPKLCLELGRGTAGLIGHTQPRRVAARSVAERVASELGTEIGEGVGYTVRFTDRVADHTYLKVMTDGILLAEIRRDRDLRRYDTIILDEAHERTLNVDFLLGYLKRLLPRRPDLKLIVTSATIDTDRFAAHFDDAPAIVVEGRTYPVEVRYRPFGGLVPADEGDDVMNDDRDLIEAVGDAVDELGRDAPGDVLVFLSGEREIRDVADALADRLPASTEVVPLYARLSAAEQHRIFEPHRNRRIVLATNVAETSLTVPGITAVVDGGTARISRYSHRLKVQRLPIEAISQASAAQRAGRCGRVGPGTCIRLYSSEDLDERPAFTDPEILRTNLAAVVLSMTDLGLGDVAAFPFLDPPEDRAVRDGVALLEELGALEPGRPADDRRLSPLGAKLARLPIDPRLGRMVLEADRQGCLREVLVIAAALSIQDPRERPAERRQAADELHRRFVVPGSDLLGLVALWDHLAERRRVLSSNRFRRECRDEFLNFLRIREWQDLHRQLQRAATGIGLTASDRPAEPDRVHRALLAGLLSQIGMRDRDTREFRGARGSRFQLAYSSGLARRPPAWVVAAELVETDRLWGRMAAGIEPRWAEDLAGHLVKRSYGDPRWDERSGRAVTDERVTLYGLPIVTGRTVGYDRVDRNEARDLFIDHALVRREWESRHRFLADNDAVLDDLAGLGDKLRRVDLVDDDLLFRFYDRRIPDGVTNGRSFDRWWRDASASDAGALTIRVEDLADEGVAADGDAYPDTWHQGDLALAVTYLFDPGATLDGVTVHVPLGVLGRLQDWDFDWQVPGYRAELVEALVATLPKSRRRELAPLSRLAERAADELEWEDRPIVDALADLLSAYTGARIRPDELDPTKVPAHLRVTFAAVDGAEVVAVGKDLDAVRSLVGAQVRAAVAEATGAIERTGIVDWRDVGDVPEVVVTVAPDGHRIEGYPALVDEGETVALKVFTRPAIAERIHPSGLRRLVLRSVPVGVGSLERSVPTAVRLALARIDDLSLGVVLRDVMAASAASVVAAHPTPVRDQAALAALVDRARRDLRPTAEKALRELGPVLVAAADASGRLERLEGLERLGGSGLEGSVADARGHLGRLVRPGMVASAGVGRLEDLHRYVSGIVVRLDRLADAAGRDRAALAEVAEVERRYRRLLDVLAASQVTPRVVEAGWTIEELRVSLFAQSVGTRTAVSAKRLRREIDALFAGDLDHKA